MNELKSSDGETENRLALLMEQYEKEILKICFMELQELSLAEDAAQETFLKAYKALPRFRGECNEKTWLMRIAINTCRDMRRSAWFRFVNRRVALERLPVQATPPQTESVFITLAIMELPPKEREVILLHCYQSMSVTETAQVLGISCAAVSTRLKRARQKLSSALKGGAEDAQ